MNPTTPTSVIEDLYALSSTYISLRHLFGLRPRLFSLNPGEDGVWNVRVIDMTGEWIFRRTYANSPNVFVILLEEVGNFLHAPHTLGDQRLTTANEPPC